MDNQRKECFFVCEESWFDGECTGDTKILAVKLGNLTPHEIFEVFESAVSRRVASFYAHYEFEEASIAFHNRGTYLKRIQEEMSKSFGEILYSDLLELEAPLQIKLHNHLDILINSHIKTYPISCSEIDCLFESKTCLFLEIEMFSSNIFVKKLVVPPPVSEDQNKDNHEQLNQSLESIFFHQQEIKERFEEIKKSLVQEKIQFPLLEFSHEVGNGGCCTTSYKIVCQELGRSDQNWVELQLHDQAFRSQYPMLRKKILNDLNDATSDKEILAKALYAVEIKTCSQSLIPNSTNAKLIVERICNNFHSFAIQITKRHNRRSTIKIKDEYDVQDLLHAILRMFFDDVRPEEYTQSYAGGAVRMDFLLKTEQIVIEVKKPRDGLTDKKLGEELIIDKEKYKIHSDCKCLICFVYDPDHIINNPAAIEKDLSEQDDTMVLIRPKL